MPTGRSRLGWIQRATCARGCLALGVVVAGFSLIAPGRAMAYEACRSDPILVVDGTAIDVISTLYTDPSAVRELDYTVTVPAGVPLGQTTLTVGLGFPEKVTYIYSSAQPWGTVQIDAAVQTDAQPFAVAVQATALTAHAAANGQSDATVTLALGHLIMP